MPGLGRRRADDDPLHGMMEVLTREGFTAVLGTNCEQTYERYLKVGEELRVTTALDSVVGPKDHRHGPRLLRDVAQPLVRPDRGRSWWRRMLFRVLKFVRGGAKGLRARDPADGQPRQRVLLGGHAEGRAADPELQRLRRAPAPAGSGLPACGALDRGYVVASGLGTVFSYVVHRHPPVPGKELPIVIALIDLDEGVRMVGEVAEVAPEGEGAIEIGMRLRVDFNRVDDELTLPMWRRA